MALDALANVALEPARLFASQTGGVEAPEVVGVVFAGLGAAGMLGEELQEGAVPRQRAALGVEDTQADVDLVEHQASRRVSGLSARNTQTHRLQPVVV